MSRLPEFYAATYWIIQNKEWNILFQKRQNTWFQDWCYQIPAGHIEWEESVKEWFIREMKEELDITISEKDCEIVHISHRISKRINNQKNRVYFDIYIKVEKYSWNIKNAEPEKCSELIFIDINNINENKKLFWDDIDVIKRINEWEYFSDVVMK